MIRILLLAASLLVAQTAFAQETCMSLHKDMDVFLTMLEDYNLNDEKEFSDNDYTRCFAAEKTVCYQIL